VRGWGEGGRPFWVGSHQCCSTLAAWQCMAVLAAVVCTWVMYKPSGAGSTQLIFQFSLQPHRTLAGFKSAVTVLCALVCRRPCGALCHPGCPGICRAAGAGAHTAPGGCWGRCGWQHTCCSSAVQHPVGAAAGGLPGALLQPPLLQGAVCAAAEGGGRPAHGTGE
jgi:hypothetical protein